MFPAVHVETFWQLPTMPWTRQEVAGGAFGRQQRLLLEHTPVTVLPEAHAAPYAWQTPVWPCATQLSWFGVADGFGRQQVDDASAQMPATVLPDEHDFEQLPVWP